MSKKKDFVVLYFFIFIFWYWLLQDHSPVEWIVFKVACDVVVDHHHDYDDEPEKAFLLLSALLTHPKIRLQRVTCASPTLSQA